MNMHVHMYKYIKRVAERVYASSKVSFFDEFVIKFLNKRF